MMSLDQVLQGTTRSLDRYYKFSVNILSVASIDLFILLDA